MFEARVSQGALWKKVIDSVKELVTEANFDCSPGGISIQAMDTAHVALVNLMLRSDGFAVYNAERTAVLGVNLTNLAKILKTTEGDDMLTLRHDDDSDLLTVIAEATNGSKTSEFQLRLMEIEAESMGIPPMDYTTSVSMPSADFAKICRDMTIFGDTVTVAVNRDGVKFSAGSEMGEGFALLKAGGGNNGGGSGNGAAAGGEAKARGRPRSDIQPIKKEEKAPPSPATAARKSGVVDDGESGVVKAEPGTELVKPETAEDDSAPAKVRHPPQQGDGAAQQQSGGVTITIDEPVTLAFALRYFNTFAKGAALSDRVELHLARDQPCMVEFKIDGLGYLRYYLAPKVDAAE